MKSGVYRIFNNITGKSYIGSSSNIKQRLNSHLNKLTRNKHANPHLQNSFNLYGKSSFIVEILGICPNEYLIKLEQWFIDNLKPEYNIRLTAHSNLGLKVSIETKSKLSKILKSIFRKKYGVPVVILDYKGQFIQEVSSIAEASEITGVGIGNIFQILTGQKKSYNSYRFVYKKSYNRLLNYSIINNSGTYRKRKIGMYDKKTNELIQTFDSTADAYSYLKLSHSGSISNCLSQRTNSAKGYKWKYINE